MPRAPGSTSSSGIDVPSRWLNDSLRCSSVRPDMKASMPARAACWNGPARLPFTCSIVTPGLRRPAICRYQLVGSSTRGLLAGCPSPGAPA